jgi:acyl dehydratase
MAESVDTAAARSSPRTRGPGAPPIAVGDDLPPLVTAPITRLQLALFAAAGADHNPIHVDDDAARSGGLPRAIAHGMLTMAFLGRLLTRWVPQERLRTFSARFVAMAFPGDTITCSGKVVAITTVDGERRAELELAARNQEGAALLSGKASVALDEVGER